MNIAQHIARFKNRGQDKILDKELQKQASELEAKSQQIRIMSKSKGWGYTKEYLEKSSQAYKEALTQADPADTTKMIQLQEAIKVRKEIIQFIENYANR